MKLNKEKAIELAQQMYQVTLFLSSAQEVMRAANAAESDDTVPGMPPGVSNLFDGPTIGDMREYAFRVHRAAIAKAITGIREITDKWGDTSNPIEQ